MPWNFPYYQVARFAGPNLCIGNTILLKHAPQCPESAEAMRADLYIEAGFPADAYINIYASNEQIEWRDRRPARARRLSDGLGAAGAAVAEIAGRNLKKVVLELGGSDPFILLGTDDLDTAVETRSRPASTTPASPATRPSASSSSTSSTSRSWRSSPPPSRRSSRATRRRPTPRSARCRRRARPSASPTSSSARSTRAPSSCGRRARGQLLQDHRPDDIGSDNPARHEEFFGPVAQVYRVKDEEEAVELANDTPYGLGSYVMTTDSEQAQRVAEKIEAGMVFVNLVGADGAELPFGGVKHSGFGRESAATASTSSSTRS